MEDREERGTPFDERAALEELERLQQGIGQRRAEREAAAERFEAFIRSFTTPAEPGPGEPARRPPAEPAPPPPGPIVPVDTPSASIANSLPPPSAPLTPRQPGARTVVLWGGALLLLAAAAMGIWGWRQQVAGPAAATSPAMATPAPPVVPETAPASQPEAAPAAQPQPAPPARPERLELEITTSRTVWVRVLADGERVLERELPAGSRVPVSAGKTIVIRTGDAGAVQVSLGAGTPEPLGQEGQVMTRTFTLGGGERR